MQILIAILFALGFLSNNEANTLSEEQINQVYHTHQTDVDAYREMSSDMSSEDNNTGESGN